MTQQDYRALDWAALLAAITGDLDEDSREPAHDEALWLEVRRRVFGYTWHLLHGSPHLLHDLDDVVQDVLLKLQSGEVLERLRRKPHPGGYVVVMIRNAAIDVARRGQRERSSLERYRREPAIWPFDVESGVDEELRKQQLRSVLRKLSHSDLALLRRRFANGERLKDIARSAGVNYSALAVRVSRLLDRIAHEMGVAKRGRH